MAELSIEAKAKAYDEAKARMSRAFNSNRCTIGFMNEIFPELKESDDERIIQDIITTLSIDVSCEESALHPGARTTLKEAIAWLEKKGELTKINPSEFDSQLNRLLKQFETLPKKELASSLSFFLNVVQNDGTYKEEKQGEQKLAEWSEHQNKLLNYAISMTDDPEVKRFLESLRNISSNISAACSEEDENRINRLIAYFEDKESFTAEDDIVYANWLKSLKDRYAFKPSEEQIKLHIWYIE